MANPGKTYLCYALTLALLFGVVAQLQGPIRWTREAEGTGHTDPFLENTPNQVLLLLLGGFRAIAVDVLWVRAMEAQDDHKWHEIDLQMKLILQLQPNFAEAIIFQAWNVAYNISHEGETLEEKWGWVMRGYNCCRTGVRRAPHLYEPKFWAAWILFDKIAMNLMPEQRVYFTRRYMEENNGRHPLRDAGLWFERAYKTPGRQLLAHRMMMAYADSRLAEFYYLRGNVERMQASLTRMAQFISEILKEYPDPEAVKALALRWETFEVLDRKKQEAMSRLDTDPDGAIKSLEEVLAGWEKEFEGNPWGVVTNGERAEICLVLAKDAFDRLQTPGRACGYLKRSYVSFRRLAEKYTEVRDLTKRMEETGRMLKDRCGVDPDDVWDEEVARQ